MSGYLPLAGVTVIELGHSVAAPYAGEILADLGADVIKVEKVEGDDARKWAPPYLGDMSATFQSLNRNKRSVVVNLRNKDELAALQRLILEKADVVIQNLRPGSTSEFGLDCETLRAQKPEIIYCNIGAFGAKGPMKDRPGYDPLMQAFSGLMSVTGEPNANPVRVGTSIIDMASGMWCVIGVISALYDRRKSGAGMEIDTSLFETALGWMCYHAAGYTGSGEVPTRQGSGTTMIVPYRGYRTKDGFVVIAAGNNKLFATLSKLLGHPEWATDPRYLNNPDRVKNQEELYRNIENIVATRSNAEWIAALDAVGIPNAPMQSIKDVLEHPQTEALGIMQKSPDGGISLVGLPLSFNGERPGFRRAPPKLGQHTQEVFGDLAGPGRPQFNSNS